MERSYGTFSPIRMLRKRPRNSRSLVLQRTYAWCDVDEGESGSGSAEQALRLALDRQAVLAKEADHRIKNSLGLVASMLGLQRAQLSDQAAKEIVEIHRPDYNSRRGASQLPGKRETRRGSDREDDPGSVPARRAAQFDRRRSVPNRGRLRSRCPAGYPAGTRGG